MRWVCREREKSWRPMAGEREEERGGIGSPTGSARVKGGESELAAGAGLVGRLAARIGASSLSVLL